MRETAEAAPQQPDRELVIKTHGTGGSPACVHIKDESEPNGVRCHYLSPDTRRHPISEEKRKRRGLGICGFCRGDIPEPPKNTSFDHYQAVRAAAEADDDWERTNARRCR